MTISLSAVLADYQAGRLDLAVAGCRDILAVDPLEAQALHLLGVVWHRQGHHQATLALFGRALVLRPGDAMFHNNRGEALRALDRVGDAVTDYRRAVAVQPDFADALNNLAIVLKTMNRPAAAAACYGRALVIIPGYAAAWYNLGIARHGEGRPATASRLWQRAICIAPGYGRALNNLGGLLGHEDRNAAAFETLRRALIAEPQFSGAWNNLGAVEERAGHLRAACHAYRRAIAVAPAYPEAHKNLGIALLRDGGGAEGWEEYEWRWRTAEFAPHRRDFDCPAWQGEAIPHGLLLLHAEQGLGDSIQFCRYASRAAERAEIVLEVQPALVPLMKRLAGAARIIARGDPLPVVAAHCPLMSLPRFFGVVADAVPYLQPETVILERWAQRLPRDGGLRVGLVWAGSPTYRNDHWRSIAFAELAPLRQVPAVRWYSLQIGDKAREMAQAPGAAIEDLSREVVDFRDEAAALCHLDLLISVDTAAAHLAGALGRPTWVLLSSAADWRWGIEGPDTRWYPSLRLYRQAVAGDWAGVLTAMVRDLRVLVHGA